jgi:hypothetical protein
MAATVSGELLSASSLALAGLALFYTRWSPEIEAATAVEKKTHKEDRYPEIQVVRRVLRTRAWPFAVATCFVAVLLAPPALTIVVNALRALWRSPVDAVKAYDAVPALFVAVWLAVLLLACVAVLGALRLRRRRNELTSD